MKKSMIALAGLAVLSAPAYASKARLKALGQTVTDSYVDNYSYYVDDQRNTFKNPAHFNKFNNFVIFEWGDDYGDLASQTGPSGRDTQNKQAEGGFARQVGSFVYAVYLGNDTGNKRNEVVGAVTGFTNNQSFIADNNRIDLSFAGDAGIQWGANLWYSAQSEEFDVTDKSSGVIDSQF